MDVRPPVRLEFLFRKQKCYLDKTDLSGVVPDQDKALGTAFSTHGASFEKENSG